MKIYLNIIFLFAVLTVCFFSCTKIELDELSGDGGHEEGKVSVTFRVMQIEQVPFENTSRAVAITDLCTRISVAVFQGDEKVKVVNQVAGTRDFGTISMALVPGEYRIVAIAHNGLANCTISSPEKITFANNKLTDTFYYYGTLDVENDCSAPLLLKRPVAMYRFIIKGDMPEEVAKMQFYYTGGSSTFDAVSGYGCVNSRQTEVFDIDAGFYGKPSQFEVYTFPHSETGFLNMKVTAFDAAGGIVKETTYNDVYVEPNVITQHTEEFFVTPQDSASSSFQIGFENEGSWSDVLRQ